MSVIPSSYLLLAKLKARYDLERHSEDVGIIIRFKHAKNKKRKEKLLELYNYSIVDHSSLFSPHSISRNEGCGCALCLSLHSYAYAKLHLHYLKKSFYDDYGMDHFIDSNFFRKITADSNFYALYSEHTVITKGKENILSQSQFYEKVYAERKAKVKALRFKYKAVQEAIQTVLTE